MGKRILVVAADEASLEDLKQALENIGLETVAARDRSGVLTLFDELKPAALLLSVSALGPDVVDLVHTVRATPHGAVLPLLLMGTGAEGERITSPSEALEIGADYYFRLPTDFGYLAGRVAGWVGETHSTRPRAASADLIPSDGLSLDIDLEAFHVVTGFDQEAVTEHGLPTIDLLKQLEERRSSGVPETPMDLDEDEPTKALFDDPDESHPPERAPNRQMEVALELVREGERHRNAGERDEAIEAYWAAAELYVLDGRSDAAISLYKLILYLDPTRTAVAKHGAEIALGAERKKDALDMYRHTAGALEAAGQLDQAMTILKEMVHLSPSEPTLVLRLASLESRQKQHREERAPPMPPPPPRAPTPPPTEPPPPPPRASDVPQHAVNEDNWESLLDEELAQRVDPSLPSIELSQSQMVAIDAINPHKPQPPPDRPPMIFTDTTREVAAQEIAPLILEERRISPAAADELLASDTIEVSASVARRIPAATSIPDLAPAPRLPDVEDEHPDHAEIEWGEVDAIEEPTPLDVHIDSTTEEPPARFPPPRVTPSEPSDAPKHRRPRPEPSRITFLPLVPNHGRVDRLMDALEIFSLAATQRVTGMLQFGRSAEGLVFVEGHPAARRGPDAAARLIQLFDQAGLDIEADHDQRPADAVRAAMQDGSLDDDTAGAILLRHLEDGVLAVLMHRGPWKFLQGTDVDVSTTEIVRDRDASIELLVELLPKVAPALELASHLGGTRAKVRVSAPREIGLGTRDARFCSWLDGNKPLDVAAALSGLANDRAAAIALVLVAFGHATSSGTPAPTAEPEPPAALSTPPAPSVPPIPSAVPAPAPVPHQRLAELDEHSRVRALADLVRTSDYFTILGVDASATKLDIDQAHHHLRSNIQVRTFEGNDELLALAREVIRSLDEARDVLKVPELREAYQRHLKS